MKKVYLIISLILSLASFFVLSRFDLYKQVYSRLHNHVGYFYYRNERFDKAIEEFQKALKYKEYSNIAYVYFNLGLTYQAKKEFKKAIAAYQMAYKLNFNLEEAKIRIEYLNQV